MTHARTRAIVAMTFCLSALALSAATASAARYAYFGNYGNAIYSTDVVSGNTTALVPSGAGTNTNGVSIDRAGGRIYWVARSSTDLFSVKLDGTDLQATDMGSLMEQPDGTAIDAKNRRVYWVNTNGSVSWADLDDLSSRGALNVGTAEISLPQGIAVDSINGRVYWTNGNGIVQQIGWASVDGSGTGGNLFAGAAATMLGVSYAPPLQRLFWVSYGDSQVFSGGTDGSGPTLLPTAVNAPGGSGYDAATNRVWITNYGGNDLTVSDPDGGNAQAVPVGTNTWGNIAIGGAGALTATSAPLAITASGVPTSGTITLKNTGDYPLEVYGTVHSGSTSIAAGSGCPQWLAINEVCDLTVTYTPGAAESASADVGLQTDAGNFKFPVTATGGGTPAIPKLTGVRAVKRCADSEAAGNISVGFTSATTTAVTASIQRSSTRLRAIPAKCPERAGNTDYSSKTTGKKTSKNFTATAGQQTKTLKQLFGTKKLTPGRYRVLFAYKDASGSTVQKGTWVWALR